MKKTNQFNDSIMYLILILLVLFCVNAVAEEKRMGMFGITLHGTKVNKYAANDMINKLTSDGTLALNPGINLSYVSDDNILTSGSILLDCYKNPAAFIGKAKLYDVEQNIRLGYFFGLYVRQFPRNEEFEMFRVGNYQVIPTPGLYAEYKFNNRISLRLNSNYFINYFDLSWTY